MLSTFGNWALGFKNPSVDDGHLCFLACCKRCIRELCVSIVIKGLPRISNSILITQTGHESLVEIDFDTREKVFRFKL